VFWPGLTAFAPQSHLGVSGLPLLTAFDLTVCVRCSVDNIARVRKDIAAALARGSAGGGESAREVQNAVERALAAQGLQGYVEAIEPEQWEVRADEQVAPRLPSRQLAGKERSMSN